MIFIDTSALAKAYLDEPGSEAVRTVLDHMRGVIYLSDHVALEVLATLAYKLRDQKLEPSRYRKLRAAFLQQYVESFNRVEVDRDVIQTAIQLADTHRKLGVGAVDLIHVATAMRVRDDDGVSLTVVCADRSMRLLASAAGFRVFDPERDDPSRLGGSGGDPRAN